MTPKENFRKFFQHERGEWFPSFFRDANLSVFITGMDERAPHNQSGKDFFGCTWVYDPVGNAAVPDTSVLPVLDDICDWREKVVFPDLDAVDWEASAKADKVDQYDPDKFNYSMLLEGPFERLHTLMGFENALCAMLTDPEEVSAFFDRLTEMKCRELDILKKYYLTEAVCFHDDWGTQKNMFFSPDIWRSLIKPQIKKIAAHCHSLGMFFDMHSCGKMDQIIAEFPEIGIDSFQGQGINDIVGAMKKTGRSLSYNITPKYQDLEAQAAAGNLTEEEVRSHIREEVLSCAKNGIYTTAFVPVKTWWFPIAMQEAKACEKEIFTM